MRKPARLAVLYAVGAAIALGLKAHYSRAGADDLAWILGPTCRLAEALGGIAFEREARAGWVSHQGRMIVGPSCAGINFLVIFFSAFFFTLVHRLDRDTLRGAWLAGCLATAAVMTVLTNALRIVLAVRLYEMDLSGGWVTPERAHRALGAGLYCVALVLTYPTIDRIAGRLGVTHAGAWRYSALVPMGWYLAVAVGVPILTRAWRGDPGLFFEHAAVTIGACALAGATGVCFSRGLRRDGPGAAGPRC